MAETDQQFEQKHLDQIMDQLHDADKRLSQEISKARSEEKSLNENFFNDFSINLSNDAEAIETAASIQQQQQLLDERSNSWQQSNQQLQTVRRLTGNPFLPGLIFKRAMRSLKPSISGWGRSPIPRASF